jgi:hypothetical protein
VDDADDPDADDPDLAHLKNDPRMWSMEALREEPEEEPPASDTLQEGSL